MPDRPIPNDNRIRMYAHCHRCLAELPNGESPEGYARLSVGYTEIGWQVWCVRHDVNVMHVDFEGHHHPANLSARGDQ